MVIYACSVLLPAKYFKYKSCCKYLYAHSTRFLGSEQEVTKNQSVCSWRRLPTTLWKRYYCSCCGKCCFLQLYAKVYSAGLWKRFVCSTIIVQVYIFSFFYYPIMTVWSVRDMDICLHYKLSTCFQSQLCC